MKLEIWKKSDYSETLKRPLRCYPGTLMEVFEGKLTVRLEGGNETEEPARYKKVNPEFGRRAHRDDSVGDLPHFIKMGSLVEVLTSDDVNPKGFYLAKVVAFVEKEHLVVEYKVDQSREIVARAKCRLPNGNSMLAHYKEIDKLQKYKVLRENSLYSNKPKEEPPTSLPLISQDNCSPTTAEVVEKSAPAAPQTEMPPMEMPEIIPEVEEDEEEEELIRLHEDLVKEESDGSKVELLEREVKQLKSAFATFSGQMKAIERKLSSVAPSSSPNRCYVCLNDNPPPSKKNRQSGIWSSGNSIEDPSHCSENGSERPTSSNGSQGITPPPGLGPPATFYGSGNYANYMGPPHYPPFPFNRQQMGNKIFSVLSQKMSEDEASKMTDAVLSSFIYNN